jgi:hypothetical protein
LQFGPNTSDSDGTTYSFSLNFPIKDPGDWVKMETKHVTPDGKQINVHWFKNKSTGLDKEFKFKIREASKTGYSGSS